METVAGIVERLHLPTDKCSQHSYGPFYDEMLSPYRDRPIRLMEIGVHVGGSIRLWAEYFSRPYQVIGVDIRLRAEAAEGQSRCVKLIEADAYAEGFAAIAGTFDVVIDDGPHALESQVAAVRLYAPRLKPGGMLVIEDVRRHDWFPALAAAVPHGCTYSEVDLTPFGKCDDDRLFVVRRQEPC